MIAETYSHEIARRTNEARQGCYCSVDECVKVHFAANCQRCLEIHKTGAAEHSAFCQDSPSSSFHPYQRPAMRIRSKFSVFQTSIMLHRRFARLVFTLICQAKSKSCWDNLLGYRSCPEDPSAVRSVNALYSGS